MEAAGAQPRAQGSRELLPAAGGVGRTVPQSIWKEPALLTSSSGTSSLQNEDRIGFCCLSCPVSGSLLERPQDTDTGSEGPDFESQP